jgi:hypothetical protein
MARHAFRRDRNESPVVGALTADGWTVFVASKWGMPVDLLCCDGVVAWPYAGDVEAVTGLLLSGAWVPEAKGKTSRVMFLEVKDGQLPASHRRLKRACAEFMLRVPTPGAVVLTPDEAIIAGRACRAGTLASCAESAAVYIRTTGGIAK